MPKIKLPKDVTIFDRTQTDEEWAKEIGISDSAFYTRMYRYPDQPHIWIKKPGYQNTNVARKIYLVNDGGIKKSMDNWLKHYNVFIPDNPHQRNVLKQKIKARIERLGWDFERSFTEDIFRNEQVDKK